MSPSSGASTGSSTQKQPSPASVSPAGKAVALCITPRLSYQLRLICSDAQSSLAAEARGKAESASSRAASSAVALFRIH